MRKFKFFPMKFLEFTLENLHRIWSDQTGFSFSTSQHKQDGIRLILSSTLSDIFIYKWIEGKHGNSMGEKRMGIIAHIVLLRNLIEQYI